eukprot:5388485-Amphidinium_carterae.1
MENEQNGNFLLCGTWATDGEDNTKPLAGTAVKNGLTMVGFSEEMSIVEPSCGQQAIDAQPKSWSHLSEAKLDPPMGSVAVRLIAT